LILKIQDQKSMNSGQSAGISPYDGKSVTYVIPASHDFAEQNHHLAGIQVFGRCLRWIPAFAGMTAQG
jgi:hypothetical protein